jgi:hypothetical protein
MPTLEAQELLILQKPRRPVIYSSLKHEKRSQTTEPAETDSEGVSVRYDT